MVSREKGVEIPLEKAVGKGEKRPRRKSSTNSAGSPASKRASPWRSSVKMSPSARDCREHGTRYTMSRNGHDSWKLRGEKKSDTRFKISLSPSNSSTLFLKGVTHINRGGETGYTKGGHERFVFGSPFKVHSSQSACPCPVPHRHPIGVDR